MSKTRNPEETAAAAAEQGIQDADTLGFSGYTERVDAPIISWETQGGLPVYGKVVAIRPAGQGKVVDIDTTDEYGAAQERLTYGCPRILERKLEDAVGRDVALICTGKNVETANGVAWGFRVFVKDETYTVA